MLAFGFVSFGLKGLLLSLCLCTHVLSLVLVVVLEHYVPLRSPHGRQAVPGPFLSPNAAPFYPRRPPVGTQTAAQAKHDKESDVSMPDWNAQVGRRNINNNSNISNKKGIQFVQISVALLIGSMKQQTLLNRQSICCQQWCCPMLTCV